MAHTPKPERSRKGRFNYTVSCIMPNGKEPIWFKARYKGKKSWRYTKTLRKALSIAEGLFNAGAEYVDILHLPTRWARTITASQADREKWE